VPAWAEWVEWAEWECNSHSECEFPDCLKTLFQAKIKSRFLVMQGAAFLFNKKKLFTISIDIAIASLHQLLQAYTSLA
jgi:hypothetical protein